MAPLSNHIITELAAHLYEAERTCNAVVKITDAHPAMTYDDAYSIQEEIRRLKEAAGRQLVGLKMGLTSVAKMKQMGVENPIYGFLTDEQTVAEGDAISVAPLIHPRVEPEIAFVLKDALEGPDCSVDDVLQATDFVLPALEIIDSRYENFRFDLISVVADNTSASRFVRGGRARGVEGLNLKTLGVVMEKNGKVVQTGAGAAVLGDPAKSVATLANMLAKRGQHIPAGTFVMTGGLTAAVAVDAGDCIHVRYQDLGSLTVRFTP